MNECDEMRCLVTGGAGFLGSSLVEALVHQGHDVIVLDNLWRGQKRNLESVEGDITFIHADACESSAYNQILEPQTIDIVFHLAAINGTKWFNEEPRMVMDVNLNSTLRSLEFAEENECRYVFTSSPEAFGESEVMPLGADEPAVFSASHHHQRHAYGASKYLGELAVQHAVRNGLDARIVRLFNGYGPRLLGSEYGQVVSMMIQSALEQRLIFVHGDGSQTRSLTYIDDLVRGILSSGIMDGLAGACLNIGSEEEITMLDLANCIRSIVEEETGWEIKLEHREGYPGDSKRRLPNLSETRKLLNWEAEVLLQKGLVQTLRSML